MSSAVEELRQRIQQSYLDGEVSHAIHIHQLEELEMAALRQKLAIMGLEESAELFGKMTAKLGPIAGPIAAAAGTALIQGVFSE